MSPSELDFVWGLFYITFASFVFKHLGYMLFKFTLSDKDNETLGKSLNSDGNLNPGEISTHTVVIALLVKVCEVSCFVNSAVLAGLLLVRLL